MQSPGKDLIQLSIAKHLVSNKMSALYNVADGTKVYRKTKERVREKGSHPGTSLNLPAKFSCSPNNMIKLLYQS